MRQDIKAAMGEVLAQMREAIKDGWHEVAHTYSVILERLHALDREL